MGELGRPRLCKRYQPRSVLWFGLIFFTLFGVGLFAIFWLAAHGRIP